MRSRTSQNSKTSIKQDQSQTQSKLEKLHEEASIALAEKTQIIQQLNEEIDQAEKQCAQLKAELQAKAIEMQDQESSADEKQEDGEEEEEEEISEFVQAKARHEEEIERIKTEHEQEIKDLQIEFTRKLKAAEDWNEKHAEALRIEKEAKIEDLKNQIESLKIAQSESIYTQTQTKNKFYKDAKAQSAANEQKIQDLEAQLSDLQSITREELRDIRAKIDECLVTVELRQQEHQTEIDRYEKEIADRNEKYGAHIAALTEQLKNEKERLEQSATSAEKKIQSLEKVLNQLEKHHQKQVEATQQDIERMKASIINVRTRGDQTLEATRSSVTQIQTVSRECKKMQDELQLIEKEIAELQAENAELREEQARLENAVYKKETKKSVI